jgi:hypothetical protein
MNCRLCSLDMYFVYLWQYGKYVSFMDGAAGLNGFPCIIFDT